VPLSLLALVGLSVLAQPVNNVIGRRIEMAADWAALEATRDPAGATQLFRRFVPTTLSQPNPPTWDYVMLEGHPTIMQRLATVEAWRARNRR
jgi:STE24 endopeptidase